jgi:hypothetical protein
MISYTQDCRDLDTFFSYKLVVVLLTPEFTFRKELPSRAWDYNAVYCVGLLLLKHNLLLILEEE